MKKLTITAAILATGLVFTACGSDDSSTPETTTPVTAPTGTTSVTGTTGPNATTGPSGTTSASPTTQELDGNQMGDQDSTEAQDGNNMGGGSPAARKPKKQVQSGQPDDPYANGVPNEYTEP